MQDESEMKNAYVYFVSAPPSFFGLSDESPFLLEYSGLPGDTLGLFLFRTIKYTIATIPITKYDYHTKA
jgi:hypothetical protein